MSNWKRWISWPVAALLMIGAMALVMRAQDKSTPPPKPPTIEELQKQVSDRDAQIAQLNQQIQYFTGRSNFLAKQLNGCIETGTALEAQIAAKK